MTVYQAEEPRKYPCLNLPRCNNFTSRLVSHVQVTVSSVGCIWRLSQASIYAEAQRGRYIRRPNDLRKAGNPAYFCLFSGSILTLQYAAYLGRQVDRYVKFAATPATGEFSWRGVVNV